MAGVSVGGGGSKSDRLNTELSLVPFIDLLSTLVLFLLLSAVWTHMGSLPSSVDSKGMSQTADVDLKKLTVNLVDKGFVLSWPSIGETKNLPKSVDQLDQIIPVLSKLVTDQKLTTATVSAADSVPYGQVIKAIDKLKSSGLISVGMSTN